MAPALDRLLDGRPCRVVPRPWYQQTRRSNTVDIEFADGSRTTVQAIRLKRAPA
jgi:hypothetical protein